MTTWDADVASYTSYELGEGPLWNPDRGILLWVDILGCRVHVGALDDGGGVHEHASFSLAQAPATLGAVAAPAFLDHERGTLVAAHDRLVFIDVDGGEHVIAVLCEGEPRRLNDGVTDPVGRYLVGSAPTGERTFSERLGPSTTTARSRCSTTTSPPTASRSPPTAAPSTASTRSATSCAPGPYDVATGAVGVRRDHVRVDDGYPDGIALDAEDSPLGRGVRPGRGTPVRPRRHARRRRPHARCTAGHQRLLRLP